jgi:hypothetical protein
MKAVIGVISVSSFLEFRDTSFNISTEKDEVIDTPKLNILALSHGRFLLFFFSTFHGETAEKTDGEGLSFFFFASALT